MKKINILFFHFDLGNGGAERVLVNLANALDPQKYNIEIRTIFNSGPNRKRMNPNIKYSSVFNRKAFRGISVLMKLLSPKLLHRLFIKDDYDIEIAFREGGPSRIISGCTNQKTKKFSWIHTTLSDCNIAARGYKNLNEFVECCKRFDGIASVSDVVKKSVERWLPEEIKVTTVYNVIEPDYIRKQASEPIELEINRNGTLNMITVGRLTPVKSFDRLLNVLGEVRLTGYSKWHLYVIGVGELMDELFALSKKNGLESNVTFLGFEENPHKYVSKMDLYVCSSLIEGYSTAVTESIINGTPVLTTDCAGMSEIFGDTMAGIIVNNNEKALYSGITEIMDNPQKLELMKRSAVSRSSFFSKENGINQFEAFVLL